MINYEERDFTHDSRRYDIVLDAVAKSSYWKCRRILKPRGCYITTVPSPMTLFLNAVTRMGRKCRFMLARPNRDDLSFIRELIERGSIRPVIQEIFPLERAAEAHALGQAHHVRGKLVLTMDT